MRKNLNKVNRIWNEIVEKEKILERLQTNETVIIPTGLIKDNYHQEPRLISKFDNTANLPDVFLKNKLNILPISRDKYIIGKFKAYEKLEVPNNVKTKYISPNYSLESINYNKITSEAISLNVAYSNNILHEFFEEDNLYPTISGRMTTDNFKFQINKNPEKSIIELEVKSSQIEIDGGFEGEKSLYLIEAKQIIPSDFIIRQLYYPYRLWQDKLVKKVVPVFMVYNNNAYYLFQYEFIEKDNYNSLSLKKYRKYVLENPDISLNDIIEIINNEKLTVETKDIPFPQADSFDRLLQVCDIIKSKKKVNKQEIMTHNGISNRQVDYYINAGIYLGLIEKIKEQNIEYMLTRLGNGILCLDYKNKSLQLSRLILKHKVFKDSLSLYINKNGLPTKSEIINIMKNNQIQEMNDTTTKRRSSTILSWIDWILSLINN